MAEIFKSVSVIDAEIQPLLFAKWVEKVKKSPRLPLRLRHQRACSSQLNLTHLQVKGKQETE